MLRSLLTVISAGLAATTVNSRIPHGSYGSDANAYLKPFLQPLDVGKNLTYDDMIDDEYLCSRNCTRYPEPRICYYKFIVEQYHTMGPACKDCTTNPEDCFRPQCVIADGVERTVLTFNRMIPGPSIQVCFGDRIVVDVFNRMIGREVTVHWHGELQRRTPWMDGVPFVTQCPVQDVSGFRYDFYADTPGSHFYHSHSGLQITDGLSGTLIVRTSDELDPLRDLYDYDLFSHTIHIKDWMHVLSDDKLPGYNRDKAMISLLPDTYLINGMGKYWNPVTKTWTTTPFAEFSVKPNKRYRFRIIGVTGTTCSHQVTFEGHSLLVVSAEGYPIQPRKVRSLYMSSGDIYDVVINTNREPSSYWIRVQGYSSECNASFQLGVLKYEGSEDSVLPSENWDPFGAFEQLPFPEFNNLRTGCRRNPDNVCLDDLKSLYKAPVKLLMDEPDNRFIFHPGFHLFTTKELYESNAYYRHYLPFSGPNVTNLGGMYADTIDNKTNIMPPFPLLSDPRNPRIDQMMCPEKCDKFCECLNLIRVKMNSVVEIVLIDKLSDHRLQMDHPFHFHGYHFSVLKLGTKEELDDPYFFRVRVKNEYPVVRDSVAIPAGGFVVFRFIADNPGFWPLHCHFTPHNLNGMLVMFQVGDPDADFLPIPRDWPKCGDYLPPLN